jgi:hypothetical protein
MPECRSVGGEFGVDTHPASQRGERREERRQPIQELCDKVAQRIVVAKVMSLVAQDGF